MSLELVAAEREVHRNVMPAPRELGRPIEQSLGRLEEALARTRAPAELAWRPPGAALAVGKSTGAFARSVGIGLMAVAALFVIGTIAGEGRALLLPALGLMVLGLLALLAKRAELLFANVPGGAASNGPRVGMGATVAGDAILEAGSVVEMGATVGAAAVLQRGAVVRMGATIGRRAVVEAGATVSWGASVGDGAVVGAGATVAAGSDVEAGARLPARTALLPGSTWTKGMSGSSNALPEASPPGGGAAQGSSDARAEHIRKACDRLEAEFAQAPEPVRAMFGDSRATASSLRHTCLDLLARERSLRLEASPDALARLDQEKAALEARLVSVTDDQVRRSLSGAVAAIAAQQRQRLSLQKSADRLEAELTRLVWTLEGMGTELLRVRSAGAELYQSNSAELAQSIQQLHDEIETIAEALDDVQREGLGAGAGKG